MTRNRTRTLLASIAFGATVVMGPVAQAHAGPVEICQYLKDNPGVSGVESLVRVGAQDGRSAQEIGTKIWVSVESTCPWYRGILVAFSKKWAPVA